MTTLSKCRFLLKIKISQKDRMLMNKKNSLNEQVITLEQSVQV